MEAKYTVVNGQGQYMNDIKRNKMNRSVVVYLSQKVTQNRQKGELPCR